MHSTTFTNSIDQGSKIRSSYIAFAQKEKKRLEAEVAASIQEIVIREKEVARLRGQKGHIFLLILFTDSSTQTSLTGPNHCPLLRWRRRSSPVGVFFIEPPNGG